MDIHSTKNHSEQSGKLMGRRSLVKGVAWAAPVVAATAAVPAYAASKNPCEYGTIVSVPWGERAERRRYKGTVNEEYEWAVMPTSNCSPQPQTYFIDNTTPERKLAYPWGRYEGVSDFPPIYPPNGKDTPDYTSKDGVGGVGGGVIINVRVENVAGDVSYAPTPTGEDRFAFGEAEANRKNNMYYAEGYKGKGANPRLSASTTTTRAAALPTLLTVSTTTCTSRMVPVLPRKIAPCGLTHTVSTTRPLKAATAGPGTFR